MKSSGILELVMFLDVCRLYLDTTHRSRRGARGPCVLWAIVTFLRTESTAQDFLKWCQCYRIPHLRYYEDWSEYNRRRSSEYLSSRFGRKLHGFERKMIKILQDYFYCGVCLPTGDLGI